MAKSGYHYLTTYMLSTVIYDLTVEFCYKFLSGREYLRIREQMIQAGRSGRQNIAEGWKRVTTKEYYDFLSFSLGSLGEIKEDIKDLYQDRKISEKVFLFFEDKCKEEDFLLNRLRQSLYQKMEREGTLPQKEQYRNFKNYRQNEQEILDKIIADAGLTRLENGQYIEKGETGEKGKTG